MQRAGIHRFNNPCVKFNYYAQPMNEMRKEEKRMNLSTISKKINPVHVLVLGVLGGAVPFFMYLWNFPTSTQAEARQFAHAPSFATWVFLLSIVFSFVTIILIPSWKICRELYSAVVKENSPRNVTGMLVVSAVMYPCVLVALFLLSNRVFVLPDGDFMSELNINFAVVYIYSALGFYPVMFCIVLINYMAEIMSNKIDIVKDNKKELPIFIQEYLDYRNLLQICLIANGILLSLNPIITSAYLSIWKEIGLFTPETFPSQAIIVYGLIFTLLLILIYVPTYITLTNVGRELRDAIYPLNIDALEDTLKNRRMLNDLLQINFGIAENLKSGIFTLTPLISGLLASLLGFK